MKTSPMVWLIRRELWEHRGSLVRTPLILAGLFLLLNGLAWGWGEVSWSQGPWHTNLGTVLSHTIPAMSALEAEELGRSLDVVLLGAYAVLGVIMGIVLFAYALGALYNERRDRSVLFWKSLPVSDAQVVASKALVALVIVPLWTLAIGLGTGLLLFALAGLVLVGHGLPAVWLLHAHPVQVMVALLCVWPLTVLAALPTVGWLLLCSAWAKSKPFLWAIVLPLATGLMFTWLRWMGLPLGTPPVGALLVGTLPFANLKGMLQDGSLSGMDPWSVVLHVWPATLASPTWWFGIMGGMAALVGAVVGRRRMVG